MRALILSIIMLGFSIAIGLGRFLFRREWYQIYLILLFGRDAMLHFVGLRTRQASFQ